VFEDLGEQLVKNIAHPIRAFRLHVDDNISPLELETAASFALNSETMTPLHDEAAFELALWDSVKDGTAEELETYLERFPEGTFSALARTRLANRERPESEEEPPAAADGRGPDAAELAFWESVKDSQQADEIEVYLEQYPEGHFAALARARLPHLAEAEHEPVSPVGDAIELAFWESVVDTNDPALFEAYLEKYPNGEFAVIAKARIATLAHPGQAGGGNAPRRVA